MPYKGYNTHCNVKKASLGRVAGLRGYETLQSNNQNAVLLHLAKKGPLSVAVDATNFNKYQGGVYDKCDYSKNIEVNHAVQLVGYGYNPKEGAYWIVRNSWGPMWGEKGYIRMKRDTVAKCGVDSTVAKGIRCKEDGITKDRVCGQCGILFAPSYPIGVYKT